MGWLHVLFCLPCVLLPVTQSFWNYNPCYPDPCVNGTCFRNSYVAHGFKCKCIPGYTGKSCDMDPCHGVNCTHNGTCSVVGDHFWCNCPKGYTGEFCEIERCPDSYCECGQQCTWRAYYKVCTDWCDSFIAKKEGCPTGPGKVTCASHCEPKKNTTGFFACEFRIDGFQNGSFHSRNYPKKYVANKWDIFIITVRDNSRVRLTFQDFQLEYSVNCSYDVVAVIDGQFNSSDTSNVIATLCGNDTGSTFLSSGNVLTVKFKTDDSVELRGFLATYSPE